MWTAHTDTDDMEAVVLSLLCADRVITEERTHKRSIIGTFTNFYSQQFPASFPPWFVYVSFANITGKHNLTVNIHNPNTDFNVFSASASLETEDKTAQVELAIPVHGASFPEPGSCRGRILQHQPKWVRSVSYARIL